MKYRDTSRRDATGGGASSYKGPPDVVNVEISRQKNTGKEEAREIYIYI